MQYKMKIIPTCLSLGFFMISNNLVLASDLNLEGPSGSSSASLVQREESVVAKNRTKNAFIFTLDRQDNSHMKVMYLKEVPEDEEGILTHLRSFLTKQNTQKPITQLSFQLIGSLNIDPESPGNEAFQRLARALSQAHELSGVTRLSLKDNALTAADCAILPTCFPHLSILNIANNPIGDEGARFIGRLSANRRLVELNIRNTDMGDAGIRFLQTMQLQRSLTDLNVSHNPAIGSEGLKDIAHGYRNLESLNLESLNIQPDGYAAVVGGVPTFLPHRWASPYLAFLNISGNPIDTTANRQAHPYLAWRGSLEGERFLSEATGQLLRRTENTMGYQILPRLMMTEVVFQNTLRLLRRKMAADAAAAAANALEAGRPA